MLAQAAAGRAELLGRQRAVTNLVQQLADGGQRLGVGGVPFGQELLVLLTSRVCISSASWRC